MRRIIMHSLALALLLVLPGVAQAQSMGGGFITFTPAGFSGTYTGAGNFDSLCLDSTNKDTCLVRQAANTLALRNSTNAQTLQVYNTYTDGSNYERLSMAGAAGTFTITTQKAGTGGNTALVLGSTTGTVRFLAEANSYTTDVYTLGNATTFWKDAYLSRSIQGSKSKSLTDAAAAAAFTRIAVANNSYIGGSLIWTATSTDATDYRALTGRVQFSGVNKGGTVTCTINAVGTDILASSNANTLACTWTNVVSTTNCDISVTCTDNTAGSQTITMNGRLDMPLTATVTPQ